MNSRIWSAGALALSLVATPVLVTAAEPDADSSHPAQFVKDSAITTAIKTKLATDHLSSLTQLKVATDNDGVVWLSGTTQTQEAADRAVEIARTTDGVVAVKSNIVVTPAAK